MESPYYVLTRHLNRHLYVTSRVVAYENETFLGLESLESLYIDGAFGFFSPKRHDEIVEIVQKEVAV